MTRMTLLHLGITGLLLGAVTYLFVQSTSVAPAEHVRISQALSSLSQAQSDLRRDLLLVRVGLLPIFPMATLTTTPASMSAIWMCCLQACAGMLRRLG